MRTVLTLLTLMATAGGWLATGAAQAAEEPLAANELVVVVMDPLALPLSCPCVKGYVQRNYDKLGAQLKEDLKRPVRVVYNESLSVALKGEAQGKAHLVIGKHSVVVFDGKKSSLKLTPVAKLTDKKGETTMTGLIVVPKDDPAKKVSDLANYRIVFGPEECDEKHAAALALLKKSGISSPKTVETSASCSDGACSILENAKTQRGAAVISSYAQPLLEGCGTVRKGDLRLIGRTEPVPFIEAFINDDLPAADRAALAAALVQATKDSALRTALETRDGFVPLMVEKVADAKKTSGDRQYRRGRCGCGNAPGANFAPGAELAGCSGLARLARSEPRRRGALAPRCVAAAAQRGLAQKALQQRSRRRGRHGAATCWFPIVTARIPKTFFAACGLTREKNSGRGAWLGAESSITAIRLGPRRWLTVHGYSF